MPNEHRRLDGALYRDLLLSGAHALQNRREEIDRLNVYPVPDGDTGSNMSMTMSPMDGLTELTGSLEEVSGKIASRFLRSARGNSGVILSLFFRGVSRGFRGVEEASPDDVRRAFACGVEEAYKAVQDPKEGTILTVMRVSSSVPYGGDTLNGLFREMLESARETLLRTPELLPVLKQAGVVDSGGTGYTEILSGMLSFLEGVPVGRTASSESETAVSGRESADFSSFDTSSITNPYCTECIVTRKEGLTEAEIETLRKFVLSAGDSVVFADDDEIIKLHVHTRDPGRVLSEALRCGSLYTVKVENMQNQHTRLLEEAPEENAPENEASGKQTFEPVPVRDRYGFVAVTMGDGIEAAFRDFGVQSFVYGGQTMNPSTSQLADAVLATPAETVFLLPNNSNVCLVAEQASEMIREICRDRTAAVIPTLSVPMGLSALMGFDPEADRETNEASMKESMALSRTLEITYAAHDATVNGQPVKEGQILGLCDRKVVLVSDDRLSAFRDLLSSQKDVNFLTVFYGQDVPRTEAEEAERLSHELFPHTDIAFLPGGQPLYAYIISAE